MRGLLLGEAEGFAISLLSGGRLSPADSVKVAGLPPPPPASESSCIASPPERTFDEGEMPTVRRREREESEDSD